MLLSYKSLLAAAYLLIPSLLYAGTDEKSVGDILKNSPLIFIENKGQIIGQDIQPRKDIDYRMAAGDVNIFIGEGAIHYIWSKTQIDEVPHGLNYNPKALVARNAKIETYRLDVILEGADINMPAVAEQEQEYREYYYLSQCPDGLAASSFKKITYKNVYPNIDWVLYTSIGTNNKPVLKYDFVVHPGGNPQNIRLKYEGASLLSIADGSLTAVTPMGSIVEEKPFSYLADTKETIASSFILHDNVLSFNIQPQQNTFIIDPQLHWSTYIGSDNTDYGLNVAADPSGAGFVTGWTMGTANFATFGAHQYTYGGATQDGYLVKFNANGTRAWATYYGGNGYDQVNDIVTDKNGNIFFTGVSSSTNAIATAGAHQVTHGGSTAGYTAMDAFLVKFGSNGVRQWGTYYGDSLDDISYAIDCDKDGNVYFAGHTDSKRYIASNGAYRTSYSGGFLAKFNPAGTRLWATYCGDTGWNYVSGIACDNKGNVYCTGSTTSYNNIATSGSHQSMNGGGIAGALNFEDGFLMKFNGSGQLQWSTYYGGNNYDNAMAVTCDERGGVYIAGKTNSANGNSIITTGAYQSALDASYDCNGIRRVDGFIAKFNEYGIRQWGTLYGYTNWMDDITRIKVLPNGSIFITGSRYTDYPCTPNPPAAYCYLARFNQKGIRTWYVDDNCDKTYADIAYNDGKLFFGGTSFDTSMPGRSTLNTFISGPSDALVQRYFVDTAVFIPLPFADTLLCIGDTLNVPFDVTNKFNTSNIITLQMSDITGDFSNATTLTTLTTDTGGIIKYKIPNTVTPGKGYRIRLIGSSPVDTSFDNYADLRISEYPNVGPVAIFPICANGTLQLTDTGKSPTSTNYTWTGPGGFSVAINPYNRPNVQLTDSGYYILEGDNYSCIDRDSVHVTIFAKPAKPIMSSNSPVCEGDTLKISATTTTPGVNTYNWAFYQGSGSAPKWFKSEVDGDTVITVAALSDTGRYVALAVAGGCPSDPETTKVVVSPVAAPTVQVGATPGTKLGPWQDITFTVTGSSNAGTSPTYQWIKNGVDIPNATGSTYHTKTGSDLQTGDTICVRLTSSAMCATPPVVISCVGIEIDLGINGSEAAAGVKLYPNPNNGKFVIETPTGSILKDEVLISNSIGQLIYKGMPTYQNGRYEINAGNIPGGIYLLRTTVNGRNIQLRFTVSN